MKKYFNYSKKVKLITASVFALVAAITLWVILQENVTTTEIVCLCIAWLPLIVATGFAPVYYEKTEDEVAVRLLYFKRRYSLDDYSLDHCSIGKGGMARLFGSGGFFGYLGWFNKKDIGTFLMYSTSGGDKYLKLTNKKTGKKVLIEE